MSFAVLLYLTLIFIPIVAMLAVVLLAASGIRHRDAGTTSGAGCLLLMITLPTFGVLALMSGLACADNPCSNPVADMWTYGGKAVVIAAAVLVLVSGCLFWLGRNYRMIEQGRQHGDD